MRLPYMQVRMEVLEQSAPDIAVMLKSRESDIGWGLLHLFKWGLGRCPDNAPPSENSLVPGPQAAALIAHAALWKGDPEAFVDACESVSPPLLERATGGIRLRGLKVYDIAWGKNHAEEWKKWRAYRSGDGPHPLRSRSETGPEPVRNQTRAGPKSKRDSGDSGAPDADADADKAFRQPEEFSDFPSLPTGPPSAKDREGGRKFSLFANAIRLRGELQPVPDGRFLDGYRQALAQGFTEHELRVAYVDFIGTPEQPGWGVQDRRNASVSLFFSSPNTWRDRIIRRREHPNAPIPEPLQQLLEFGQAAESDGDGVRKRVVSIKRAGRR